MVMMSNTHLEGLPFDDFKQLKSFLRNKRYTDAEMFRYSGFILALIAERCLD